MKTRLVLFAGLGFGIVGMLACGDDEAVEPVQSNPCDPATCAELGAECGNVPDGCGDVLSCGTCADGETCGAAGPNKCGTGTCTPVDCAEAGAECGLVGDGCGEVLDCGGCPGGEVCGAQEPNQCGSSGNGGAGGSGGAAGAGGSSGSAGAGAASGAGGGSTGGSSGGSTGGSGGGSPGDPTFVDISCLPDVLGGVSVVEGQPISCSFGVTGAPGESVELTCEDDQGNVTDCGPTSGTQIQPFGSNPLPLDDGWFGTGTAGLAGDMVNVVWVATDGQGNRGTYTFEAPVVADDGVNEPPTIEVNCAGDTDGAVSVAGGEKLECDILLLDPDPDQIWWDYTTISGAPVNSPGPYSGVGGAPYTAIWHWDTTAAEAGSSFVFRFTADDETAPVVEYDLTVDVT